jgi:cell division septal protein FtsQ
MIENTTVAINAEKKNKPAKKRAILFIKLVLSLIVVSVIIIYAKNWDSSQKINKIEVTGVNLINPDDITSLIQTKVINKPKGTIDFSVIKRIIDGHPLVATSSVVQTSSGELNITIREKIPVATVRDNNNTIFYVDYPGTLIKYKSLSNLSNLPSISGVYFKNKIDKTALTDALHILSTINTNIDYKTLSPILSEIKYSQKNKSYMFLIAQNLNIYFGKTDGINDKLRKLDIFLKKNNYNYRNKKNQTIDLRWENQLIVKNDT